MRGIVRWFEEHHPEQGNFTHESDRDAIRAVLAKQVSGVTTIGGGGGTFELYMVNADTFLWRKAGMEGGGLWLDM